MSCVDLLSIFVCFFIGSWAIPADTSRPAYQPLGNQITCDIQAFFANFFPSSMLYSLCLMIYYLLYIKYQYKDKDFRVIEPVMHVVCWGWGICTGIAGIVLNLFHNSQIFCWIAMDDVRDETDYTRNRHDINIFRWAFVFGPVWLTIVSCGVILMIICCHVRKVEKEIAWVRGEGSDAHQQSRNATRQALLYMLVFLASWLMSSIFVIVDLFHPLIIPTKYPWLLLLSGFFLPLMGFFNALVYTEKSYKRMKQKYPDLTVGEKVSLIFFGKNEEEARRLSSLKKTKSSTTFNTV